MSDRIYIAKQKDLFTIKEAAEYLTVCPKTLYRLIMDGRIEAIKIGCRYKITSAALIRFIEKNKFDL